jgi:pSer/pThr/pTyr-binding forkhead associated (FHA) protein
MSEVVVFALRILFLALIWLFILFVANIVRTDLWGKAVPVPADPAQPVPRDAQPQAAMPPEAPVAPVQRRPDRRPPKYLTVDNGPLAGRTFTLSGELNMGRSIENQIILTDDFASGHHARIVPEGRGVIIEDQGSTNGTFVNGVRVEGSMTLNPGDSVRIGRTTMTLGR